MTGDLTIHGITKTVALEVTFKGPATNPYSKKPEYGVKITGKVKRSDYKLGDKYPGAIVSDDVLLTATGEFVQG